MDSGAHKLLESAVQRTLHAHAFSRSSSQASSVITDLLSRYLALVTSTCSKYAQHAGRTGLNVRDAVAALDELGLSVEELSEYCATEGKELNRYALYSARRIEDLHEFRTQLSDGLRQDRDDAIRLEYSRCPTPLLDEMENEQLDSDAEDENEADNDVDSSPSRTNILHRKRPPSSPAFLPLSPSSPLRKRPRSSNWEPSEHIPDFLPPFPTVIDDMPFDQVRPPSPPRINMSAQSMMPPPPIPEIRIDKPPVTLSQSLTTAAASDILVQVPYSQSSLSSIPEWHLPSGPPPAPATRQTRFPIPQIEPSLISAYHHILTHPAPAELPPLNPSRHKVVMSLIHQSQSNPRYTPADTLFGTVGPCPPRLATIGPSYAMAIGDSGKPDGQDKDTKLPPTISRPVSSIERIAPFVSQQTSRIPDLARHVLPPAILARTSRLSHPPVLHRGNKPLVYGSGVPAPWNANVVSSGADVAQTAPSNSKTKEGTSSTNEKDKTPIKPVLPDARLYATWDYETKDFRVPFAANPRGRNRMGSIQASGGSGMISLSMNTRNKGLK